MGKRIHTRRQGRGTKVFQASTHKRVSPAEYPAAEKYETKSLTATIEDFVHDPGRGAPLALIHCQDGREFYNPAAEGVHVGQTIQLGSDASVEIGNILPLKAIPEGTFVYNIEKFLNDGGRFVRASGGYATVIAHDDGKAVLKLTSGKTIKVGGICRATIGVVAGGGRTDKPFITAGQRHHMMRARGHKYPRVKGVSMIAALHPFGGGRHKHPGKPMTVARGTPPGRKVGLIAAAQTGRAKKRRLIFTEQG